MDRENPEVPPTDAALSRAEALAVKILESRRGKYVSTNELRALATGIFDEPQLEMEGVIKSVNAKLSPSGPGYVIASAGNASYKID